jgi:hypothetical protein
MKKLLATLALILVTGAATAASIDVSWTNPTTYTDGTTMPAADIAGLKIMFAECPDGKTFPASVTAQEVPRTSTGVPTTATVDGLRDGVIYCFAMSTRSVAYGESNRSTIVSTSTPSPVAPVPAPPSGVTLKVRATAKTVYMEVRGQDRFALVAVGEVPADTTCDPTQSVNGYYVVPNAAVKWAGSVKPPVVVAKCS